MDMIEIEFNSIEHRPQTFDFAYACDRDHSGSESNDKQSLLFLSAGLTAMFTSSSYNALDCLRVRWQVQNLPSMTAEATESNIFEFASRIIRTEGVINGLWRPGIIANALGMGASAALRFGYYEKVRDAIDSRTDEDGEKNGAAMIFAGLSCGAVAYFVTTPLHLLKTKNQAERASIGPDGKYIGGARAGQYPTDIVSGAKQIVSENGLRGLWRGCIPLTLRGSLFTGGQMLGYDGFKSWSIQNGTEDGPSLQLYSSLVSAACATILSTPADFIMSRYMSSNDKNVSTVIRQIYTQGGALAFWRGSVINFCRITPVMLTYSIVYEHLRWYFGIGYLT